MARVLLSNVRKVYDNDHVAVENATFEAGDRELLVFVGPSGCGKSTLLRMIAGLESITAGTISIGDRVVNDLPPKSRDIAMVFQNYALYPHMSVYDNMAFGLKLRSLPKGQIDERVKRAAAMLGIESVLDRKPKELSGGQRQRVALGRALVREPAVFLLDEPLSNLDAKLRLQTRAEIAKLHRQLSATMIYVTHDQIEAMTLGDRIVVLEGGRVQQIDTPMALYERPANRFVAGFIGSPAMNFIDGRIETGQFVADDRSLSLPMGGGPTPQGSGDREVVLGIRPEDISIGTNGGSKTPLMLELVEPIGSEMFLYTRTGHHQIVARVSPQAIPQPGATVDLTFDSSRFHFFDPASGVRL